MPHISSVDQPHQGALRRLAIWSFVDNKVRFVYYLAIAVVFAALPPAGATYAEPQVSANADPATPVEILIPSIGVDALVEQVGLASDGAMGVPQAPNDVAWYTLGPAPGAPGNAVIAGHVDWAGVLRPFYGLKYLQAGDAITVIASDSTELHFTVTRTEVYEAAADSVSPVFLPGDDTALTLITCGGDFDHTSRQYLERFVVRAVMN